MEAYRDVVKGTREFSHNMNGTQAGNPDKVGAAIEKALAASPTPLRLALGADAVANIRAHSEQLLKDLATWEQVGLDVGF
jgi:hypothetical protein